MTSIEMKKEFLIGYDKVANLEAPGYEDSEISYFLTKAQENFILSYINPDNKYRESFEETEKTKKYFSNLVQPSVNNSGTIKTSVSTNQLGKIDDNSVIYDLPSDHWLTIAEWAITNDACRIRKDVEPITHDEYNANAYNPFKKPNSRRIWRLDLTTVNGRNRHELIKGDNYTITEYHVRYIKKPNQIVVDSVNTSNNIDCELHESAHRRIVDEAIKLALETSEERRLGSFVQINNK
jgi:hypothetical protein